MRGLNRPAPPRAVSARIVAGRKLLGLLMLAVLVAGCAGVPR